MSHGVYRSRDGRERIAGWSRERLSGWGLPHAVNIVPTSSGNTFALTAGSGPTVLLLPGTNFSATTWLEVVTVLSEAFRVVALDLPGQPGLSAPERPRCAAAYGDWLGDVINQLDLREVVVVGHSLGAVVAMAGAARGAPVAAMVLYNPAGLVRLRVTARVLAATLPWLTRPSSVTAERLVRTMTTQAVPDHLAAWMALVGRHVRTSLAPAPLPDAALLRVQVPVAIFAADHDPFLPPALVRRGAERLPDAGVTTVADAGHLLPHEQPLHVLRAVRASLGT